jgi:hypothetical protein
MKTTALTMRETKNGAPYKVFVMEDGNKLSVFNFDARYGEIDVGTDLPESVLLFDPAYSNYKLRPLPKGPQVKTSAGYKTVQMEKVMETKAANIEVAQTRKNDAIALAGAMRDSTLITLAALKDQPFPTDEEFKAEWVKWVKWILSKHDEPFL